MKTNFWGRAKAVFFPPPEPERRMITLFKAIDSPMVLRLTGNGKTLEEDEQALLRNWQEKSVPFVKKLFEDRLAKQRLDNLRYYAGAAEVTVNWNVILVECEPAEQE